MSTVNATDVFGAPWPLTAREAAHALPVLQFAHPGLRDLPAPRLSMIRNLARRGGIHDGALRTALSRACSIGTLQLDDGRYRLGPISIEQAAAAKSLGARVRGYTVGVVLEGTHPDLRSLRELFSRLGFRPMQRSVWVGARTADDRLTAALHLAGRDDSVVVFQCDEVDANTRVRLAALWNLTEREAELRGFHRQLIGYVAAPNIDRRESAWRCVEAAPVWYRVAVQNEPPFPIDLCGSDYPLGLLNADWSDRLESLTHELIDLWGQSER
jgi:DNA-binding transcriptional regulator PaaX